MVMNIVDERSKARKVVEDTNFDYRPDIMNARIYFFFGINFIVFIILLFRIS